MTPETALFKVVGMYCISCKPIVEKQLKDEKAVKSINIVYIVDFDPSLITTEEIKNRLDKSGYIFVRSFRACTNELAKSTRYLEAFSYNPNKPLPRLVRRIVETLRGRSGYCLLLT
jgi:copper chaperone